MTLLLCLLELFIFQGVLCAAVFCQTAAAVLFHDGAALDANTFASVGVWSTQNSKKIPYDAVLRVPVRQVLVNIDLF